MFFFFFNDTATTEIYTLSLHDALPIWCFGSKTASLTSANINSTSAERKSTTKICEIPRRGFTERDEEDGRELVDQRSEEHTSELQSQSNIVCRLLLEKKKQEPYRKIKR